MNTRAPRSSFHHAAVIRSGAAALQLAGHRHRRGRAPRTTSHRGSQPHVDVQARCCRSSWGSAAMPSSSSSAAHLGGRLPDHRERRRPATGSRSMRSSSACSGSSARYGHEWNPRQPEVDRPQRRGRCRRSRARRDVVPFGVLTRSSSPASRARFSGTRFWKNDVPPAPLGKRCSSTGRSPIARISGSLDGQVVADEVELRLAPLREEHLLRAGDRDRAAGGLHRDLGVPRLPWRRGR